MNKPFKILVVADTISTQSSGGKTSRALIEGFIEQGFVIKVLHYSRKEIDLKQTPCISIQEKKTSWSYAKAKAQLIFQRLTGCNINHWVESRKGFSYAHDYDVKSIQQAIEKESPVHYDYILALSYASSFRAHKAILKLPQWHEKFLAYIHDPFPMHSYPRPYDWVEPGHQKKRDFFVALFKAAKSIIYPSQMLGEWMESYYPSGKNKAVIIPHLITKNLRDTGVYPSYFDSSKFNILHAGSLMSARNPMTLLKAFMAFIKDVPEAKNNARLVMVGSSSIFHQEMAILSQKCSQIILSPNKEPFETTFNMQQQAAVNVVLEAKGPSSPFLPGKVPHCIAANKPILLLGPYYSETRRILGEYYQYYCEIDDMTLLKNHLTDLYLNWENKNEKTVSGVTHLKSYFESSSILKALEIIKEKS
ncbi:UDP-glycosyltransferase [Nonlabens sp.]|uniref:UDP-glycosyltransferase n=1 Tax=Nonlabens sp. TaxID=1888209 RepID=UPI0025D1AFB9|nr:UDP-glycosyltransferase [Nonlabens sp.]